MRVVLALVLWLIPLAVWAQEDDRGRLTRFLEENLSGAGRVVTVTGFRGALSSRASVELLTIADDQGIWLTLRDVVLDWNRLQVLRGNIEINELTASEIIVARAPVTGDGDALPAPEAGGFALPDLPVAVRIGQIAADRVVMGQGLLGQEVVGRLDADMTLSGGEGRANLTILRQDDGPEGRLVLAASYANASGQLVLSLDAEEGAGGIAASLLGLPGRPAARLTIAGSGPLTGFGADIALTTDGVDRLKGRITTGQTVPGEIRFTADLGGDVAPLFLPDYAAFFGNAVRLQVEGVQGPTGLDLSRLAVSARALVLEGNLALAPGGRPLRATLRGRMAMPDGTPVLLPITGPVETRVDAADLSLTFDAARGEGWSARAVVAGLDRTDVRIARLSLAGSGRVAPDASLGGTFTYGTEGLVPADVALAEALGTNVRGRAVLHSQAGSGVLTIGALTVEGADYRIEGSGDVQGLSSGYAVDGRIAGTAADLSRFAGLAGQPLSGAATFDVSGSGSLLGGDVDVEATVTGTDLAVGQPELDNLLRGSSRVALSVARGPDGTDLHLLDVAAGRGTLRAQGSLATAGSRLTADLDFPDLAVLGPGYRGGLMARTAFDGTREAGQVTLTGTGRDLALGQGDIDRLLAGETALDVALVLDGAGIGIDRATLSNPQGRAQVSGSYDPAGSDLRATFALPRLAVMGGGYGGALEAEARFTGTTAAGTVALDGTGRGLSVGQPEADRLLRGDSTLRLRAGFEGGRIRIDEARLRNPQVEVTADGSAEGAAREVRIDGRLTNLALLIPEFPGPLRLTGTAREDAAGYTLDLRALGPGQIDATARGRVSPGFRRADLAIAGSAQAALANAFLGTRAISGALRFDLALNGPFALSSLSGPVRLSGGRFSDPDLPFSLTDMAGSATLRGQAADIDLTATATSGGRLAVQGNVGLAAPYVAGLDIRIDSLRLRDPELYEAVVDASLRLSGPLAGGGLLAGRASVAEAELRVPSTGLGGASDLPGLRHVNEPAPVRTTRARAGLLDGPQVQGSAGSGAIALDLTVSAPNRVFVRGRGLDAELGGEIGLRGTTAAIIGSGALSLIRGRLDILGKRLTLSIARLEFQGDLIPYIEIVASNDSDGVTSSVVIEGRADTPVVRFTSSPELPEEEVLARLLFDQGLGNISALQAARLAGAVATLAGRGGDGIVGRLRKGFGFDDLDLATDAEGGTTLRAGKYLSENLYTEVEVAPDGKSSIQLNLDIRPGVTAKGTLGTDGEAGIGIYLERDY
ncbi:MAG: translocation/assembly module TamB domain-containing protein [Gemmobacter sp.]